MPEPHTFLEFFAGGGMARAGLGPRWRCLLANDMDAHKCAAYRANFGDGDLVEADIAALDAGAMPLTRADLAWASFPCQDLSLAGGRAGLQGARSGAFFQFWRLVEELRAKGRGPRLVTLENVAGLLTSNGGADFRAVIEIIAASNYAVSALVVDARAFTPQSRPRLFIFGFSDLAPRLCAKPQADASTPASLIAAVESLSPQAAHAWRWLSPRPTAKRNASLADMIDEASPDWCEKKGARALRQMSARQRAAVDALREQKGTHIGAAFRRIRIEDGARAQRVEARFDGVAGCLRTPAGGSSRQLLLKIENKKVFARLLGPREAARLMGLPDEYVLPQRTTAALKLAGDGVCVPAVRWIAEEILEPALSLDAEAA